MKSNFPSEMQLQYWAIERFAPYARNPRKNDAAVNQMVASIREFGCKVPILARSDGEVIDGHLRLKAARKVGLTSLPVLLCDEWSPAQVKAFRLLVNRSATWAEWDTELLGLELQEIQAMDFDLKLTGFNALDLDRHAGIYAAEVAAGITAAGFAIRAQIIWAKHHFVISRGHYHWQHEPCWYAVRQGKSARWRGDRDQSTLWQVANLNAFGGGQKEDSVTGHGTQKPVELMRRAILNHTEPGELVYDPFLGSGTTLIAAEQTGRVARGLEIDPRYVDVAVRRWQTLTGLTAVLDGELRSFDEIAAARRRTPDTDSLDGDQGGTHGTASV